MVELVEQVVLIEQVVQVEQVELAEQAEQVADMWSSCFPVYFDSLVVLVELAERVAQIERVERVERVEVEVSALVERVIFAVELVLADQLLDMQNSCLPSHFGSFLVLAEQAEQTEQAGGAVV